MLVLLAPIKKHGKQEEQGLGRSRGGFSTKIHAVCDALGNPLRFIVTTGQRNDCTQAIELFRDLRADNLIADKGYDVNAIIKTIEETGCIATIPPKSNRRIKREYDAELYKERHKIECLFGFLKHYRRLFARFEKTKNNFSAFLHFVAALQWLK
jgi:transposase